MPQPCEEWCYSSRVEGVDWQNEKDIDSRVNVISFTDIRKLWPSLRASSRCSKFSTAISAEPQQWILIKWDTKCEKYTCKNIYSVAFTVLLCTKTCFWTFPFPNLSKMDKNLWNLGKISFMLFTVLVYTKLILAQQSFVKNSYNEFHQNPTNNSDTDIRAWTDCWYLHISHSLLLCKERLKSDMHTGIKVSFYLFIY